MSLLYLDNDVSEPIAFGLRLRGHDVLTTRQEGRIRAGDEEQIIHAAQLRRVFVSHNWSHFHVLQRAWRYWSDEWGVLPRPLHFGILIVDQLARDPDGTALRIHELLESKMPLENRLFRLGPALEWKRFG